MYNTEKMQKLYDNTYASMVNRTHPDGYAQTSLTGAYVGMFGRDTSIQILAHVLAGDDEIARRIMTYVLEYHKTYNADYILHVMNHNEPPISRKVQVDSTYFFIHSWYWFSRKAEKTQENADFLKNSEAQIKAFARRFLTPRYIHENGLIWNSSLEHSREGRYFQSYDLLTNIYASQALHELSLYFADGDPAAAKEFGDAANGIANAVNTVLVGEMDGKKYYTELIDTEFGDNVVVGFSWVSLAPMGCNWFAMNKEYMQNTYELYQKYSSVVYYGKCRMLEVTTDFTGTPITKGNHIIGKGLAWEMMYSKETGNIAQMEYLADFVTEYSDDLYRETWGYNGGGSDTANQEHASWMLVAHITCFPELLK